MQIIAVLLAVLSDLSLGKNYSKYFDEKSVKLGGRIKKRRDTES